MRKLLKISLLTLIILVFSLYLAACGKGEKTKSAAQEPASEKVVQPATPPETKAPETSPAPTITETSPAPEPKPAPAVQQAGAENGKILALARKSGCLTCHSVNKKLVGPAWKDVATRYKSKSDARTVLIEKVSKGGRGNWSDVVGNVAMPPYYPRVSKENIERLVDFILSL
jgi:cytochrome c